MHCTGFYSYRFLYLNTGLKVCCTHTSLSGHTSSDSVMVLCEMCSALVEQDVSRRIGYSYGHSVHSCPLPKHKNVEKLRVSIHTEQGSSCKALETAEILSSDFHYYQFSIYPLVSCNINRELLQAGKILGGEKGMGNRKSSDQFCQ